MAGYLVLSAAAQQTIAPAAQDNKPQTASQPTSQQTSEQTVTSLPSTTTQSQLQDQRNDQSKDQKKDKDKDKDSDEKELLKKEQSQRILGIAPEFGVTSRQNAEPLTKGQKFHLFTKSAFDPFNFASAGFQAGLGQAQNEFPGYGQGAAGYGKRYGASFADQVSSNFFSNYFYPVLFKEDPRYFRLGEGSIKHRIVWSMKQEFLSRSDSSRKMVFNWSNVLGAFSAGGLSNAYYPSTDRGFGLTISRSTIALAYGSVGGLVDEFWPDIHRKLRKHKTDESAADDPK